MNAYEIKTSCTVHARTTARHYTVRISGKDCTLFRLIVSRKRDACAVWS